MSIPAFPACNEAAMNETTGMTLRDYFAGQWIAAGHHANLTAPEAAEQAYEMADAMLAERDK